MKRVLPSLLVSLLVLSPSVAPAEEPVAERLERLEAETQLLREELGLLGKRLRLLQGKPLTQPTGELRPRPLPADAEALTRLRELERALQEPWKSGSVAALVSRTGAFLPDGRCLLETVGQATRARRGALVKTLRLASDDLRGRR